MEYTINTTIHASTREEYRRELITLFLDEVHGSTEDVSLYNYYVETLSDGTTIYLKRPTALNKGVDFEVRVTDVQFRYGVHGNIIATGNRPSHDDIINDLISKKGENHDLFAELLPFVTKVYNCEPIELNDIRRFNFANGLSVELILTVIKWLFIEQDITYWNRSGREMLYNSICEIWED